MTAQLELDYDPKIRAPIVTPNEIEWMFNELRGKGWRTARQLGAENESVKRDFRAICRATCGRIISGQKGYKLTLEATIDEIRATVWLKNQGYDMVQHWMEIQRVAHPILAGAGVV